MASWEDGPEFAPLERPVDFGAPAVAPLDSPPPRPRPAADAPSERPEFGGPEQPVAALDTLTVSDPLVGRNPTEAFTVASTPMTEGSSAWSAAHWNPPSEEARPALGASNSGWAPPVGAPALPGAGAGELGSGQRTVLRPPPAAPIVLSGQQPPLGHGAAPQPGTPGWFAPPAATPAQPPLSFGGYARAITPGVIIALVLGGVVPPVSPLLFVLGFVLAARVRVAGVAVRRTFTVTTAMLAVVSIVALFVSSDGWWGTVGLLSVVCCWVVLLVCSALVVRRLQTGQVPTPRRNTWG